MGSETVDTYTIQPEDRSVFSPSNEDNQHIHVNVIQDISVKEISTPKVITPKKITGA